MKRIFCLLLAACMMLSLCACGKGREKDAGNDTLSSNEEASASAESIPTPKEQETPGESEPSQPYAGKVDVDLTVLSSTMVYSEVYNMLYNDPAHYLGKTVKARGEFSIYQLVTDGVLQPDPVSYACIISDAAACCAEGMEFVPVSYTHLTLPGISPTRTITRSWGRRSPSSVNFSPMKKTG